MEGSCIHDYGADLAQITLPVQLVNFGASLQNGIRTVLWTTAEEYNTKRYEIEYSATGTGFSAIGSVAATNTNTLKNYSFTDNISTNSGMSYYRLKIVHTDGGFTYSSIASVKSNVAKMITVYPNPANEQIIITVPASLKKALVKIINSEGKTVAVTANSTGVNVTINVSDLSRGAYWVQVEDEGKVYSSNFIKQ